MEDQLSQRVNSSQTMADWLLVYMCKYHIIIIFLLIHLKLSWSIKSNSYRKNQNAIYNLLFLSYLDWRPWKNVVWESKILVSNKRSQTLKNCCNKKDLMVSWICGPLGGTLHAFSCNENEYFEIQWNLPERPTLVIVTTWPKSRLVPPSNC